MPEVAIDGSMSSLDGAPLDPVSIGDATWENVAPPSADSETRMPALDEHRLCPGVVLPSSAT